MLYFASSRTALSHAPSTETIDLPFPMPLSELKSLLMKKHQDNDGVEAFGRVWDRSSFAVDEVMVNVDVVLSGEETVGVIPPVSGG